MNDLTKREVEEEMLRSDNFTIEVMRHNFNNTKGLYCPKVYIKELETKRNRVLIGIEAVDFLKKLTARAEELEAEEY
jgi:hypothetical protein